MATPAPPLRDPSRGFASTVEIVGRERKLYADMYHSLLRISWPRFFALVVGLYVAANAVFALLYLATGDGIAGARPGSYLDAYFFSVQTMATIGYGVMAPRTVPAHILVAVEALLGLLFVSMATGLMFAKFARPTARVMFSRVAVLGPNDGRPALMLRMANARASQIVEATARLTLMREERTAEGTTLRRFYDLKLARAQSTVFALSWLLIHPITPESPLHGISLDEIRERGMYFIVSVIGLEDTFGQTVNARYTYWAEDVVYEARFADILTPLPDGRNRMDLTQFHEVVALPGSLSAQEKKSA